MCVCMFLMFHFSYMRGYICVCFFFLLPAALVSGVKKDLTAPHLGACHEPWTVHSFVMTRDENTSFTSTPQYLRRNHDRAR